MNQENKEAQHRATKVIETTWEQISDKYSLGWGGPIEWAEDMFPYICSNVKKIRDRITVNLPIVIFQTRELPPKSMVVAIPLTSHNGNPYNTRLIPSNQLVKEVVDLLSNFSQALWFLVGTGILPEPTDADKFTEALLKMTGKELLGA